MGFSWLKIYLDCICHWNITVYTEVWKSHLTFTSYLDLDSYGHGFVFKILYNNNNNIICMLLFACCRWCISCSFRSSVCSVTMSFVPLIFREIDWCSVAEAVSLSVDLLFPPSSTATSCRWWDQDCGYKWW